MYLLDTNVISRIAPARRRTEADESLAAWMVAHSDQLWLSLITAAEVEDGIAKAARTGATRKAADLAEWWGEIRHYYAARILPLDLAIATETGHLMDRARAAGTDPGFEDLALAATAKIRDLTLLTDNVKHFAALGVRIVNPFEALP